MIPLVRPLLPRLHKTMHIYQRSVKSGKLSNFGPCFDLAVEKLYQRTARYVLPATNGTAAIQVAAAVVLDPDDVVAIPDYTHIGTYAGIKAAGFKMVGFGCEDESWLISLEDLTLNRDKFDAFVVTAPFGIDVDFERYENFSTQYGKKIIWDFAGAYGQFPKTKWPVCYSLHATKGWTTGEGGLVSFADAFNFERARQYTNFGLNRFRVIESPGFNLKMDELRCAMICSHMDQHHRIENRFLSRRFSIEIYKKELGLKMPNAEFPSLAVFSGMSEINKERIFRFEMKPYYPLLSSEKACSDVLFITKSNDQLRIAIPLDVSGRERDEIIKSLA